MSKDVILSKIHEHKSNSVDNIISDIYNTSDVTSEDLKDIRIWKECLNILKPGGYLLAFGGDKMYHRLACAIEDAGFEIRDVIMWLYNDKSKSYSKPDFEPIIIARKVFKGSLVENILEYNIGGFNINDCRIDFIDETDYAITANKNQHEKFGTKPLTNNLVYGDYSMIQPKNYQSDGRFPANTILTYCKEDFEIVCSGFPYTESNGGVSSMPDLEYVGKEQVKNGNGHKMSFGQVSNAPRIVSNYVAPCDSGSASRYFYNATYTDKDLVNDRPMNLYQYIIRLVSPENAKVMYLGNRESVKKAVEYENIDRNCNYKYTEVLDE